MVIAADYRERQNGQTTHEDRRLAQVLPGNPAFRRIVQHQSAEDDASNGPRQPQIHLQEDGRVSQT